MAGAIACAVAEARPRGDGVIGIIPAGRGNDFARTHGIPFTPVDAARLLLVGQPRPMDLIEISGAGENRVTVAGSVYLGIASVAGQIANEIRLIRGPLVYPISALRALASWKPARFVLDFEATEGEAATLEEFTGYGVVIANFPYFGAGMNVAPAADTNDGLLEVVLMRHASKLTFLRLLLKIKKGAHTALDEISFARAQAVTVTFDRPMIAGADGESFDISPPLVIRAVPRALNVIAP
jgi:diacylglycerol kinase family enzyme